MLAINYRISCEVSLEELERRCINPYLLLSFVYCLKLLLVTGINKDHKYKVYNITLCNYVKCDVNELLSKSIQ